MTFDELKVHVTRLQQIARDTTKPLKVRMDAATELSRLKKLAAKSTVPPAPIDAKWVECTLLLLSCARLREDKQRESEIIAELDAHGIDYPDKPRPEPKPERERPAAPLPVFDEPPIRNRKLTYPRKGRVIEWDQFRDTF
jgi:hypothetical protein